MGLIKETSSQQRKKILIIARWPTGGIRTFLKYMYGNLAAEKYQITVMCPYGEETKMLLGNLEMHRPEFAEIDVKSKGSIFAGTIHSYLRKDEYDLVHVNGYIAGINAILPALIARKKIILSLHDVFLEKQRKGLGDFLKRSLLSGLLPLFNKIHAVSWDQAENLLDTFPILRRVEERIVVIPNGVDLESFAEEEIAVFPAEMRLPSDAFLIGFFGRFMAQKGFRYLVDAVEIISKAEGIQRPVKVLAFGESGFKREEKHEIEKRGLECYFRFLPFVENISSHIRGLDLVVIPSLWEACPILPMEVLICGTPLIASDCIGLREVTRGTPSRVVASGNSEELATAIMEEIENPSREIFKEFVPEAEKRFDIQSRIPQYLKLLDEV